MAMEPVREKETIDLAARVCIWSIVNQDIIGFYFRVYMWTGVALILCLAMTGRVSVNSALSGIALGGTSVWLLVAMLIGARRHWMLGIRDERVRRVVHQAMLSYLQEKDRANRQRAERIRQHRKRRHFST
jgi:hypothetical protein